MAAPDGKIRWGVLGYAKIARESVIPAIVRSSNSVFHALASRDPIKRSESQARYTGGHVIYDRYESLLEDPSIDAVYIPLPNSEHCAWTIRAAEHGKHVLCEKPLALDAGQCREMIAACAQHRVTLMEAFMYRYTDRTRQVIDVIRSGVLGELKFIEASFRFLLTNPASIKLKPELGGGALYDVGCYPVNFTGVVADTAAGAAPGAISPQSVSVECTRVHGVDEMLSALLRYPSGMIAALHCGFNAHTRVRAEIVGTKGVLEIPDPFLDQAGSLTIISGTERREVPVAASDRYRAEIEDFANAILTRRTPLFSLAESVRNAEVLDRLLAAR
jgi:D-xylose 1-dehydrogenase (NADP+, D-xylono-1,5-lactone-forming)